MSPAITRVRAEGDAFTVGLLHGEAQRVALHAFVEDALCRLNRLLPEPVTLAQLRPTVAAYRSVIAAATPALAEEIVGLGHGAGLDDDLAHLLQLRREILGYHRVPTIGDCTTYARTGPAGQPVLAQTVDLNGNLDDQIAVLHVVRPHRSAIVLSFAGLLGYLGVNSAGLAVGLNLVLGGVWRPGIPPYLAIRHLLDTADTVEQAVEILGKLPLASSRSIMLCDTRLAAYVEILGEEIRVTSGAELTHTNHFLHPDFVSSDELNIFARNSSLNRLAAIRTGLARLTGDAEPEQHFGLLSQPPVCVPDSGDIRRERSVAAVVMLPAEGELHLRPGDPSRATTRVFRPQPDNSERYIDDATSQPG